MPTIDIQLLRGPLDVAAAAEAVTCPEAGGIDIFLGTTRSQHDASLGTLSALDYHAYDEMALREIRKISDEACTRWPIQRLVVWHRVGTVRIGEASVIIAVGCPHREEAFAACRYVIDQLKERAPIWKKEIYENSARWQGAS